MKPATIQGVSVPSHVVFESVTLFPDGSFLLIPGKIPGLFVMACAPGPAASSIRQMIWAIKSLMAPADEADRLLLAKAVDVLNALV